MSPEARAKVSAARSKPQADCICEMCGKTFQTHQSEIRRGGGRFCSKSCASKKRFQTYDPERALKISSALTGRVFTPEWKSKISLALRGKPSNRAGRCCSEETKKKLADVRIGTKASEETKQKMSAKKKGNKNSSWRGGVSFGPYCPKFNREFKERVRAFFDYTCLGCGIPQNGERLTVHHINYNKQTCCDGTMPMFAPLCRSCHGKTNHNREYWEGIYSDVISTKFSGKSFFTKEEMTEYKKRD